MVDAAEYVGCLDVIAVEIYVADLKRGASIQWLVVITLMADDLMCFPGCQIVAGSANIVEIGDDLLVILFREVLVIIVGLQIRPQIRFIKGIRNQSVAHQGAGDVMPVLFGQALDEYFFVFALVELYINHLCHSVNCVHE